MRDRFAFLSLKSFKESIIIDWFMVQFIIEFYLFYHHRTSLNLPGLQEQLIQLLWKPNKSKPFVVIFVNVIIIDWSLRFFSLLMICTHSSKCFEKSILIIVVYALRVDLYHLFGQWKTFPQSWKHFMVDKRREQRSLQSCLGTILPQVISNLNSFSIFFLIQIQSILLIERLIVVILLVEYVKDVCHTHGIVA
jgi:hypothetical protein